MIVEAPALDCPAEDVASRSRLIVRLDPTSSPPGDPWSWLKPEQYRRTNDMGELEPPCGIWTAMCPLGCGSRVEIWQVDDGSMLPFWCLAGPCYGGCEPADMAERLAAATGRPAVDFMPPVIVDDELLEALCKLIERDGRVGAAWRGEGNFKSNGTRLMSLGYRMEEAGASPQMIALAQQTLAQQIGP